MQALIVASFFRTGFFWGGVSFFFVVVLPKCFINTHTATRETLIISAAADPVNKWLLLLVCTRECVRMCIWTNMLISS